MQAIDEYQSIKLDSEHAITRMKLKLSTIESLISGQNGISIIFLNCAYVTYFCDIRINIHQATVTGYKE